MAEEAVRALNAQGILTGHAKPAAARLMIDTSTLPFGGIFSGNMLDKSFMLTPFKDVSGTITITAPANYAVSTNGTDWGPTATITADASWVGGVVSVRFAPTDSIAYNGELTIAHTSLTPDYGNTVPNAKPGAIALTGNGKVAISGTPATATWPMFSGTTIVLGATTEGAITRDRRDAERPRQQERQLRLGALRHARRHVAGRRRPQREPLRRVRGARDHRDVHARLHLRRRRLGRRQQHAAGTSSTR